MVVLCWIVVYLSLYCHGCFQNPRKDGQEYMVTIDCHEWSYRSPDCHECLYCVGLLFICIYIVTVAIVAIKNHSIDSQQYKVTIDGHECLYPVRSSFICICVVTVAITGFQNPREEFVRNTELL